MSIVYIRAAIHAATGIWMKHHDIFMMLLEEGLIVKSDIGKLKRINLTTYKYGTAPIEIKYDFTPRAVDTMMAKNNVIEEDIEDDRN